MVCPSDRLLVTTWVDQITGAALDVGCGSGHWTSYLAGHGVAVQSIDRVAEFIAYARATGVPSSSGTKTSDKAREGVGRVVVFGRCFICGGGVNRWP